MDIIFTKSIYEVILEISSVELQIQMWLGINPELVSSYSEVRCKLYDDNLFEEFVSSGAGKMKFTTEMILKLQKLNELLNSYEKTGCNYQYDRDIIKDKNWLIIVEHSPIARI
jgi:hypothetical protein